ncbi:BsaA family SipW-dependent biofilm matrix protein [Eubacterium multiforme]|uniref:Alternate signal-mediated exported protein n=1 Tax=Eubacterium multiforme TaxID=83339 RepID=A0ABT9UVH6_9FIRM|nr:BsaA family SipW-dependent biofilm matrix protein [Eubacterium multiforme]MDQ0150279.1 alternate signal-mediated exported protein [Eubacterium multiforme]
MKKKKIKLLVSSMAVAAILVGGTLAWFQFHQNVPNHFTTGSVKTDIVEHFNPNSPEVTNMQPGVKIQKEVSIKNTGKSSAFIRVKLDPEWDAKTEGNLPKESAKEAVTLDTNTVTNVPENDKGSWIYNEGDGYYYYTQPVAAGGKTTLLLNGLNLKNNFDLTAKYQDRGLTVNVTSDAIQTTDGAWQDAWNSNAEDKDSKISKIIRDQLNSVQTTNVSTQNSDSETNGSTVDGATNSDAQTPLAK